MNKIKYAFGIIVCDIIFYFPPHKLNLLFGLLTCALILNSPARGQSYHLQIYPQIGKTVPDYAFSEISYFNKKTASIKDFRCKWLVLDFWDRFCAGCIAAMPGLSQIQKDFGQKVQVLLVGLNSSLVADLEKKSNPALTGDHYIRDLYKKLRNRSKVDLPVAWDTVAFKNWQGDEFPLTVVIDPSGIVKAISYGIAKGQLSDLMEGRDPVLNNYNFLGADSLSKSYNRNLPLLVNGVMSNGGIDTAFMYRELLMRSTDRIPIYPELYFNNKTFQIINVPLATLYKVAYTGTFYWDYKDSNLYGKYFQRPILVTKDSSELLRGKKYCYSLTLNKTDKPGLDSPTAKDASMLKEMLQKNLNVNFPYKAVLENRRVTIYKLITLDSTKIKTINSIGGRSSFYVRTDKVMAKNVPINKFLGLLLMRTRCAGDYIKNCTNIKGNVDMLFEANTGDIIDISRSLIKYGLTLETDQMIMKSLVIYDKVQ